MGILLGLDWISLVIAVLLVASQVYTQVKERKENRKLYEELSAILQDSELSRTEKRDKGMNLCNEYDTKMAYGAYCVLSHAELEEAKELIG